MEPHLLKTEVIEGLNPGVRELVVWLNEQGYSTTDSGDGTNFLEGMEGACEFPMIVIQSGTGMVKQTHALLNLLERHGVDFSQEGRGIEASYSPVDGVAVIVLTGVLSKDVNMEGSNGANT